MASSTSMYQEGQVLLLRVRPSYSLIQVRIKSLFTPFTRSSTMVVEILDADMDMGLPDKAVLKLFDRRFAHKYREWWTADDWSPEIEQQLLKFCRDGDSKALVGKLHREEETECDEACTSHEKEAILSVVLSKNFDTEVKAYDALAKHQGVRIPKFYTALDLDIAPGPVPAEASPELFSVSGILIQHIDGFPASDIHLHTAQSDWNFLVKEASKTVGDILHKSTVINEDVRPDNMIIARDGEAEGGYRFCMIDLGHCSFRDGETDEEWGGLKHTEDEEGAMGCVMQLNLEKIGFKAEFVHPHSWIEFANGDLP